MRPRLLDVVRDRLDRLRERRDRPDERAEILRGAREGVGERQEEEIDFSGFGDRHRCHPFDRRQVVAVRLHHALGRPRRSGRVDDRGDLSAADSRDARVDLAPRFGKRTAAAFAQHSQGAHAAVRRLAVGQEDLTEIDALLASVELETLLGHLVDLLQLRRVLHEAVRRFGIPQDVAALVGQVRRVNRDRHCPGGENPEIDLHPFRPRTREQRDLGAGRDPGRDQPGGDFLHGSCVLVPRDLHPTAVTLDAVAWLAGEVRRAAEEHIRQILVLHRHPP